MSVRVPACVLAALLLAACGESKQAQVLEPQPSSSAPTASASPLPDSIPPDSACPKGEMVHLPADQGPVTDAFLCGSEDRPVAGDGVWLFQVVRRITGGLDPLLAAYNPADAAVPRNVTCPMNLPDPLVVWLHSADGVVAVRAARDVCSHPTADGTAAYDAMTTTIVWEKKDRQTQTELSIDSRCSDAYKDMLTYDIQSGQANRSDRPTALVGPVSVCTYRVETDAQGDRIGHLDGHRVLTGQQVDAVNAALARVRVDETCSRREHTRFALLTTSAGAPTDVALDGCAVSQNGSWWRAGDDLRSALH